MERHAKKIIVFSLAAALLSGVGATAAQAAPQNKVDWQQEDQQQDQQKTKDQKKLQQQQDQKRSNVQRQEQQRLNTQKDDQQERQQLEQKRSGQQRLNAQKEEQQQEERQRAEQKRLVSQRQEQQKEERQRAEQQRLNVQRQEQDRQHSNYQRPNNDRDRNDRDRNDRDRQEPGYRQRDSVVGRNIFTGEQYNSRNWRENRESYEHRQPWEWRSRNHYGRRLIADDLWDREFPGLRSYRWYGPGFWYQGNEYQDLVLFYDDDDALVSIGFWDDGQFIMIRDNDRRYYNSSPFVLRYRDSGINLRIRL